MRGTRYPEPITPDYRGKGHACEGHLFGHPPVSQTLLLSNLRVKVPWAGIVTFERNLEHIRRMSEECVF